jgi:predicted RNA-binding protein associated with RNAse of E/G family
MTDLFLDLWIYPDHRYIVLDQDEFRQAQTQGWISAFTSRKVQEELQCLLAAIKTKQFPPHSIHHHLALPKNIEEI